jgi:hypothetical protein
LAGADWSELPVRGFKKSSITNAAGPLAGRFCGIRGYEGSADGYDENQRQAALYCPPFLPLLE